MNATLGMTKRRRLAGPVGMSRQELKEMAHGESLLEQILKQTAHAVLRIEVMHVIDQLTTNTPDPQVSVH